MATPIVMPKLGNSVESSIIVRWHKNVGDTVAAGDAICEVETDKASVDVESPAAGVLLARFFDVGDDVPVMVNIAVLGVVGEHVADLRPGVPSTHVVTHTPHKQVPTIMADAMYGVPTKIVSPRARNLAQREGVAIETLQGSGPGGRIIERDVQAALNSVPKLTPLAKAMVASGDFNVPAEGANGRIRSKDLIPAQADVPSDVEIIPLKGVRKVIAARMLQSLQTTAQLTLNTSADARALQAYRKRLKSSDEVLGLRRVTINDLVMFAVSRSLSPELNSLFYDDTIYRHRDVHLGFAVDTPRGLIVPIIREANKLSLKALADEAWRLARACQEGTIKPHELEGGTFTVSNLGSFGIESFTPVLNPPQVAILGVGSINLKAVDVDGEVTFVPHIGLSLTINHQVVDGAPGARFLQRLVKNLAEIETLLAF